MKSAVFERQQGRYDPALEVVSAALSKYPKFAKLYMIQGQIHEKRGNRTAARAAFAAGLKACPKEETLWILASRLEEADGRSIKARSLLEKGRLTIPQSEALWAEAVHVEERVAASSGGGPQAQAQAKAVLARALQECPTSGVLWSLAIWAEPRPARKARSVDALKKTKDNPVVTCTVARLFWAERKIEQARRWFARSVGTEQDKDLGDNWAWWLKFERQHGTQEYAEEVIKQCVAAEPHHSPVWQSVAKDDANVGKSTKEILLLVADALH